MKLKNSGQAGSVGANDIYILVEPRDTGGIMIDLESPVMHLFGRHIERSIREVAENLGAKDIYIKAVDGGALDYTIRSRVEAAIKRLQGGGGNH